MQVLDLLSPVVQVNGLLLSLDQHRTLQFQTTVHADHLAALILFCTLKLTILLPSVSGSQSLSLFSERLAL